MNNMEFENLYKTKTRKELAEHFNVSKSTINRRIKELNCFKRNLDHSIVPNNEQLELIIGSLLGDGSLSISKNEKSTFKITHGEKQFDYLQWKNNLLKPFSRELVKSIVNSPFPNGKTRKKPSTIYTSYTFSTNFFKELEKKWYVPRTDHYHFKRRKIIPEDLKLTPFTLAIWFFDDGRNSQLHRNASISTDGFTLHECDKLVNLIDATFNIKCKTVKTKIESQFEIYFPTTSYLNLIEVIKPYAIAPSIQYKVDLKNYKHPKLKMLTRKEVNEIRMKSKNGMSTKDIASEYKTSQTNVSNIVNNKIWTNNRNQ